MEFIQDSIRGAGTIMLALAMARYWNWQIPPAGFLLKGWLVCWAIAAGIGVAIVPHS